MPANSLPGGVLAPGARTPAYGDWLRAELAPGRLLGLAIVSAQFTLLVAAIRILNIESESFERVLTLALGGFLLHHFLPAAWRAAFFAVLSVASVYVVFGAGDGTWLLAIGLVLIALCHLPVAFGVRIGLLLAFALALAAARAQWLPSLGAAGEPPQAGDSAGAATLIPPVLWPILGSMFMFRLVAYLYDLRHGAAAFGFSRAVGYFFMLPNVCFPLFPVVDYRQFQRSSYSGDALRIYQVGLTWMARGLVHLLLYRYLYLKGVIEPASVASGLDAGRYILTTYLLYLKVSGLFHLVVGMLHMYGYALPETHHLYLLSASFTDFWRRINIYWKDFLQKVVFNPCYFALRRLGHERALVAATLIAFAATWLLHSYQWFWIRGSFPVVWSDLVFWLGLGAIVVVNVLIEARAGQRRFLTSRRATWIAHALVALKTAATFVVICLLWTIWSTPEIAELEILGAALLRSDAGDLAVLVGVPLLVGITGALLQGRKRHDGGGAAAPVPWTQARFAAHAAGVLAIGAACIYVALRPLTLVPVAPSLAAAMTEIRARQLNPADMKRMQRGYYEDLGDVTRFNTELWSVLSGQPKVWRTDNLSRGRDDAIEVEYVPSSRGVQNGVVRTINSHGMRDREYARDRPPGTYRVALVGTSHDAGWGVGDGETYENVAEDRLNRELGPTTGLRYEILNFSYEGYKPIQKLAVVERKMPAFRPDVVLYVANLYEYDWLHRSVPYLVGKNLLHEFPFLLEAMKRAGLDVRPGARPPELVTAAYKLGPYADEILGALFRRLRESCEAIGARPVVVLLETADEAWTQSAVFAPVFGRLRAQAEAAGIAVLDLHGAFDSVRNRSSLLLAPGDSHTNAKGHALLGERLSRLLIEQGIVPSAASGPAQRGNTGGT